MPTAKTVYILERRIPCDEPLVAATVSMTIARLIVTLIGLDVRLAESRAARTLKAPIRYG